MKKSIGLVFLSLFLFSFVVYGATLDVTQPNYVTDNSDYDRNPSIVYDGSNYWLFYTKGDTCSARPCDVDGDTYVVYYKTATSIDGLSSVTENELTLSNTNRPANFDQRVVSAIYYDGDIWAIVSSGQSGTDRGLYYYLYSGGSWTGPYTIFTDAEARGGHVNAVADDDYIYLVWESSDGSSDFYRYDGVNWSSKIDIADDNQPKIEINSGILYVVGISDDPGNPIVIHKSVDDGNSWTGGVEVDNLDGFYDPTALVFNGEIYVVSAPYDSGDDRQYLMWTKSTDGLDGDDWTDAKQFTLGGYGSTYWWDYWPEMISDGSDVYVFYTTERDDTSLGDGEIAYYKLNQYEGIQLAVDAAGDGDTVKVGDGTYAEQVIINKDLTLESASNPVIVSPSIRDTYTFPESSKNWDPIIFAYGGAESGGVISGSETIEVTVDGFEIDGQEDFKSGSRYVAVLFRNVKGEIKNNILHSMGVDGTETFGVSVYGDSDVDIEENSISEYSRGGIGVAGDLDGSYSIGPYPDPKADVVNNNVTGPGPNETVTWAPNGIQFGYGAEGSIKENTVTGNGWPGSAWSGTGILIVDTSDVIIEDNEVYNNEQAIGAGEFWNPASDIEILNNKIYDNSWGISIFNDVSNTIVNGNKIVDNEYDAIDVYSYGTTSWKDYTGHYPENTEINFNDIYNNGEGLWTNNPSSHLINALSNWWGSCDGPSGVGLGNGDSITEDGDSGIVDYDPWLGICIENKTEVTCAYELNDIELEAYLNTSQNIKEAWFSIFIDGVNTNHTVTPVDNWVSYVLSESELSGEETIKWNVYATDDYNHVFNNSWKEFYVRNKTELFVDPSNPDGLGDWYITEPEFSLMNDPIEGGNIYYRWDSTPNILYTAPFGLENIPNPPSESAGTLELHYWTDFGMCGNETEQTQMFYIDLINPLITNLNPENESIIYNDLRPEISVYLDEVWQSNSGIDQGSVIMKVDGATVTPAVNTVDTLDAVVSYIPDSDLTEGTHNVYVYAKDNAGRENELDWNFSIELTSIFNITVESPESKTYGERRVPITVSLSGDVELLEYKDNTDRRPRWRRLCRNCDGYDKTKSFRDGPHEIVIRATDDFGFTREETINFEVDSKKPRIIRTEPKRKSTTNGENFKVRYTEYNLKNVEVSISDGTNVATYGLGGCEAGRNKECSTILDLSDYDGQWVEYWFNVSDDVRGVQSRVTKVKVDTTDPILVVNEPDEGVTYGRRVPFNLNVTNEKVKIIEYRDNLGRWRRLCSRCDEYDRTKSFKRGDHTVNIRAVDYAGNMDQETISFNVDY